MDDSRSFPHITPTRVVATYDRRDGASICHPIWKKLPLPAQAEGRPVGEVLANLLDQLCRLFSGTRAHVIVVGEAEPGARIPHINRRRPLPTLPQDAAGAAEAATEIATAANPEPARYTCPRCQCGYVVAQRPAFAAATRCEEPACRMPFWYIDAVGAEMVCLGVDPRTAAAWSDPSQPEEGQ